MEEDDDEWLILLYLSGTDTLCDRDPGEIVCRGDKGSDFENLRDSTRWVSVPHWLHDYCLLSLHLEYSEEWELRGAVNLAIRRMLVEYKDSGNPSERLMRDHFFHYVFWEMICRVAVCLPLAFPRDSQQQCFHSWESYGHSETLQNDFNHSYNRWVRLIGNATDRRQIPVYKGPGHVPLPNDYAS
jgi:hypothetical protein